jgi:hypothetical protein
MEHTFDVNSHLVKPAAGSGMQQVKQHLQIDEVHCNNTVGESYFTVATHCQIHGSHDRGALALARHFSQPSVRASLHSYVSRKTL